jgi:hypothetical protein
MSYEEEDTCMSYEEEDTFTSYEEDACMSYEEENTCMSYGGHMHVTCLPPPPVGADVGVVGF